MNLEYEMQTFKNNAKQVSKEPLAKVGACAFFLGAGASVLDIFLNNNLVNLVEMGGQVGGALILNKVINNESASNKTNDQVNKQLVKSGALLAIGFASKLVTSFFPPADYISNTIMGAGFIGVADGVIAKYKPK